MESSRRSFLASVGAVVGLGGCSGFVDRGVTDVTVQTPVEPGATDGAGTGQSSPAEPETPPESGRPATGPPVDETFDDVTRARASEVGTSVRESVVKLTTGRSGGTGWLVGDGEIVTNSHVADAAPTLSVETFDGRTGSAQRVGYHEELIPDVALLETDLSGPALPLGSDDDLERGDPLVTVGHPASVGDWIISLGRFLTVREPVNWVLSTVPTDHGNSGGPLLTLDGSVVGVVSGSTRPPAADRVDFSRNETAFTELPEKPEQTTAVTLDALEASLSEWR
jgi:S1-C subfamily serine protease